MGTSFGHSESLLSGGALATGRPEKGPLQYGTRREPKGDCLCVCARVERLEGLRI